MRFVQPKFELDDNIIKTMVDLGYDRVIINDEQALHTRIFWYTKNLVQTGRF
jgi:hypothetical protein